MTTPALSPEQVASRAPLGSTWYFCGRHVEIVEHVPVDGEPGLRERDLNTGATFLPILGRLFLRKATPTDPTLYTWAKPPKAKPATRKEHTNVPTKTKTTTAKQAALDYLAENGGGPLPVKTVTEEAARRSRLKGKTPAATVAAQIYTSAKKGVGFRIPERGMVALAEDLHAVAASKTEAKPDPKPTRKPKVA